MPAIDWPSVFQSLLAGRELEPAVMRAAMESLISKELGEVETAAFLIALRQKGETAGEIAVAAQVLRDRMIRWDAGKSRILDTCGTGGDSSGTFNISTATAFVVAGAGVPVVKHGNRAISSRSGSADVLGVLGVPLQADPGKARRTLDRAGLVFCFAPHFHPALAHLGPIRKRLGVPTIFNCLGPLANPAGASHQLLGVGRAELLDLMAGALHGLGTARTLIVHSQDGLDEISLAAPTEVRDVTEGGIRTYEWMPEDFGLEPIDLKDLRVDNADASARLIEDILEGKDSQPSRVVLANAAAALLAFGSVTDLKAGVESARVAISSGRARQVLQILRS